MTPLERAARALCVGRDPDDTTGGAHPSGVWVDEGEPWWTGGIDQARDVLAAIREPDLAMYEAPGELLSDDRHISIGLARLAWTTMIDAALEEG